MKLFSNIINSLALATTLVLGVQSVPAIAFTINATNDRTQLLNNLLGTTTGLSNFNISFIGDGRAIGTFADDPFNLTRGIVLSSGKVEDLVGANTGSFFDPDLSTDFGFPGSVGDSISMQISFDADNTVDKLYFQYVFGSEELLEWSNSEFNDEFTLKLNGINRATLSSGDLVSINNLAISPDLIYSPVGTGPASDRTKLDGYSKPLLFEAPLIKNFRNTLIINIQDVRDGLYDSAVLLKGGTLGTVRPPDIIDGDNGGGTIPVSISEPSSNLGILGIGVFLVGCWLKQQVSSK